MAKATRLVDMAQQLAKRTRRSWFQELQSEQQKQITEVIEGLRDGRVKASYAAVSRLMVEQLGLAMSSDTIRAWLAERVRESSDG